MLVFLANVVLALSVTLLQVSFFSHLPSPFAGALLTTSVATWLIIKNRKPEAAGWLLLSGLVLDLRGPYGFGTELALAGAAYAVMSFLFARVFSNDSYAAAFLIAGAGVLTRFMALACLDGVRVIFGNEPFFLVWEPNLIVLPVVSMLTTGVAAALLTWCANLTRNWLERVFLSSRNKLKL